MNIMEFNGEDFKVMMESDGWKIGFLRYSKRFADFGIMEKHLQTDEAFVLLEGRAILYEGNESYQMERCKVYNIPRGIWHHIVVSKEATVMVVENANTSIENTERKIVCNNNSC